MGKQQKRRESKTGDYNRLFDELPTPMYIYDNITFRFLAVNDATIEQYGYSREEFLNLKVDRHTAAGSDPGFPEVP